MTSDEDRFFTIVGVTYVNWNDVAIFLRVAETGSFSAAAARTEPSGLGEKDLSAVSIARRVRVLEATVGGALIVSGPRGILLTERGERLRDELAPLVTAMREARRAIGREATTLGQRTVRISGTEPVLAELLAPHAAAFLRANPAITLQLTVSNAVVSLASLEADIALRFAEPEGDSLIVRKVAAVRRAFAIHRDLAENWRGAMVCGYDNSYGDIAEVRWLREQRFEERMRLRSSSTRTLLNAVLAGAGLALLPRQLIDAHSELATIDDAPEPPDRTLWMMVNRDNARVPEVRSAMNWIAATI